MFYVNDEPEGKFLYTETIKLYCITLVQLDPILSLYRHAFVISFYNYSANNAYLLQIIRNTPAISNHSDFKRLTGTKWDLKKGTIPTIFSCAHGK